MPTSRVRERGTSTHRANGAARRRRSPRAAGASAGGGAAAPRGRRRAPCRRPRGWRSSGRTAPESSARARRSAYGCPYKTFRACSGHGRGRVHRRSDLPPAGGRRRRADRRRSRRRRPPRRHLRCGRDGRRARRRRRRDPRRRARLRARADGRLRADQRPRHAQRARRGRLAPGGRARARSPGGATSSRATSTRTRCRARAGSPTSTPRARPRLLALRRGATVIRPGDVYGRESQPWVVRPLEMLRRGRFVLPAPGDGLITPVYVDDLVDAIVRALREPRAAGRAYTVLGRHTGHRARLLRLPRAVARPGRGPRPAGAAAAPRGAGDRRRTGRRHVRVPPRHVPERACTRGARLAAAVHPRARHGSHAG